MSTNPFPCGGIGQRPCPPTSASKTFTQDELHAYGEACYWKGVSDAAIAKNFKDTHGNEGGR